MPNNTPPTKPRLNKQITIANFADSQGSRWHIFKKNKNTCLCGNHKKNQVNDRRIHVTLENLEKAENYIEDKLGNLQSRCKKRQEKIEEKHRKYQELKKVKQS